MGWKAIGPTRRQRLIESMPDKSDVKKWFPVGFRRMKYNRRVPASWRNAWLAMESADVWSVSPNSCPGPSGCGVRNFPESHGFHVVLSCDKAQVTGYDLNSKISAQSILPFEAPKRSGALHFLILPGTQSLSAVIPIASDSYEGDDS